MVLSKRAFAEIQLELDEERKKPKACEDGKTKLQEELKHFQKKYSTDTERLETRVFKQNEEALRSRGEVGQLRDTISDLKIRLEKVEVDERHCKERTGQLETQISDLREEVSHLKHSEKEAVLRQLALNLEYDLKKKFIVPCLTPKRKSEYFYNSRCDETNIQNMNIDRELYQKPLIRDHIVQNKFSGDGKAFELFESTMKSLKKFSQTGAHPQQKLSIQQSKVQSKIYARWLYPSHTRMTARAVKAKEAFPN